MQIQGEWAMDIFSIAICDDEPEACEQIIRILKTHPRYKSFKVYRYSSGEQLRDQARRRKMAFDLIILDIRLKELDGVQVGEFLRQTDPGKYANILFISSDSSYAMRLFALRPLNFLLKPIEPEKLLHSLDTAIELAQKVDSCFTYKYDRTHHKLSYDKIRYFESKAKRIIIHCTEDAEPVYFYARIDEIVGMVSKKDFWQIHQSFVVNWLHVKSVDRDTVILDDDTRLPISRNFQKAVQENLIRFFGEE